MITPEHDFRSWRLEVVVARRLTSSMSPALMYGYRYEWIFLSFQFWILTLNDEWLDGPTDKQAQTGSANTVAALQTRDGTVLINDSVSALTDRSSNSITLSGSAAKDSMGVTALSAANFSTGPWSWTDVNGGSPQVSVTNTNLNLQTNFAWPRSRPLRTTDPRWVCPCQPVYLSPTVLP